jgi:hypothetical protein
MFFQKSIDFGKSSKLIHFFDEVFVGFKIISQCRISLAREMGAQDSLENRHDQITVLTSIEGGTRFIKLSDYFLRPVRDVIFHKFRVGNL